MDGVTDLRERIDSIAWFHSIDLGDGHVTPGQKPADLLAKEADAILGPVNLDGCSVADIGAWNGYFSVACRQRKAASVLAVDEFTWIDPILKGRESIELVREALSIDIGLKQIDIANTSRETIGEHDVVLFLGVFYHLFNAQTDLMRIAECARDLLIVETHQDALGIARPAMIYYPGSTLSNDDTNWWGPNPLLMTELLKEAGFAIIRYRPHPTLQHGRGIYHAFRTREAFERLAVKPEMSGAYSFPAESSESDSTRQTGSLAADTYLKPMPRTVGNLVRFFRKRPLRH